MTQFYTILMFLSDFETIFFNSHDVSKAESSSFLNEVCMQTCRHARMHMHAHTRMHTHTRTHACTHARTHTHTPSDIWKHCLVARDVGIVF